MHCPDPNNPFGFDPDNFNMTLRVIRCLNDEQSVTILKDMQTKVMQMQSHPNILRNYIMAMVPQDNE